MTQPLRAKAPSLVADDPPRVVQQQPLGFLINDVARLIRNGFATRVSDVGLGLTGGEARALVHAVAAAGARQNEIAERMGVEPMTLCGYVDRLEARGLVERQPHPDDRRAKKVVPTPEAGEAMALIMPVAQAMMDEMLDGVPEADVAALRRTLEHMREKLSPRSASAD